MVSVLYPCGTVVVSSLGYFLSVVYSYKPYHNYFPLYLVARHIQEYIKKKRWRKPKFVRPQQEKARHEERIKKSKVIVRAKLVVGY